MRLNIYISAAQKKHRKNPTLLFCPREGRCLSASAEEAQAPCADCSLEGGLEAETVDAETMAEAIESDTEFED